MSAARLINEKPPGWTYHKKSRSISKEFECKDFMSVVKFIGKIARLAEKMDHHPDLHLTHYRRSKVVLMTHSEGKVTEKDLMLAGKIDSSRFPHEKREKVEKVEGQVSS